MNKNLEKMKKDLTRRNVVYVGVFLLTSALVNLSHRESLVAAYANTQQADFMQGFVLGGAIVLYIYCIFQMSKNLAAMKDEQKLTRLYNELNDERTCKIESLSGKFAVQCSAILLLLCAIGVSFFSFEAAMGIIGAVVVVCLTKKISMIYYNKRY